jgi:hypothetical protein
VCRLLGDERNDDRLGRRGWRRASDLLIGRKSRGNQETTRYKNRCTHDQVSYVVRFTETVAFPAGTRDSLQPCCLEHEAGHREDANIFNEIGYAGLAPEMNTKRLNDGNSTYLGSRLAEAKDQEARTADSNPVTAYQNWRGLAHDVAPFGDLQQSAVAADLKNYQVGKATILLQLTTLTFGLSCTKAANPKPSLGQLWGQPAFFAGTFPRSNNGLAELCVSRRHPGAPDEQALGGVVAISQVSKRAASEARCAWAILVGSARIASSSGAFSRQNRRGAGVGAGVGFTERHRKCLNSGRQILMSPRS